jgi:hypothetical protein
VFRFCPSDEAEAEDDVTPRPGRAETEITRGDGGGGGKSFVVGRWLCVEASPVSQPSVVPERRCVFGLEPSSFDMLWDKLANRHHSKSLVFIGKAHVEVSLSICESVRLRCRCTPGSGRRRRGDRDRRRRGLRARLGGMRKSPSEDCSGIKLPIMGSVSKDAIARRACAKKTGLVAAVIASRCARLKKGIIQKTRFPFLFLLKNGKEE